MSYDFDPISGIFIFYEEPCMEIKNLCGCGMGQIEQSCAFCQMPGCSYCMIYDKELGECFCDSSGPGKAGESECKESYYKTLIDGDTK